MTMSKKKLEKTRQKLIPEKNKKIQTHTEN